MVRCFAYACNRGQTEVESAGNLNISQCWFSTQNLLSVKEMLDYNQQKADLIYLEQL